MQLGQVTAGLQTWSQAQLYEVLVDFFSNHLNVSVDRRRGVDHPARLRPRRHPQARDGFVHRHAPGRGQAPRDVAVPRPRAVHQGRGQRELRPRTARAAHRRAGLLRGGREERGQAAHRSHGRPGHHDYTYQPACTAPARCKVLGFSHANSSTADGQAGGDALLRYLATHSSTATRLARKLCIRLVSDTPSETLVAAVANAYTTNGTKILPMVDTILRSDGLLGLSRAEGAPTRRERHRDHADPRRQAGIDRHRPALPQLGDLGGRQRAARAGARPTATPTSPRRGGRRAPC